MSDLFSPATLMKAVEQANRPSSFLLDTYFPMIQTFDTESVVFDVIEGARKLAPLVSPVVEGQVVQASGYSAKEVKPAYVKPKTPVLPSTALKRVAGEKIGGGMSNFDRMTVRGASILVDHVISIIRLKEWMGSQVLQNGKVTLSGEKYVTQEVDFLRDTELTVTLLTTSRWGEAGVDPYNDVQDWVLLVLQKSGTSVTDITMGVEAWKLFYASASVQDRLNYRNDIAVKFNTKAHAKSGGTYQGSIGNLNFFTYADFFKDSADVLQPMLPDYSVILGGPGIEGVQAHGAILDEASGFRGVEFFPKSWVENDPSVRMLMTQSAPLIVPCNVNATMAVTVR